MNTSTNTMDTINELVSSQSDKIDIIEKTDGYLTIAMKDMDEFPIIITIDDDQILCSTNLWNEAEVIAETREEMLEAMLVLNIPMALSTFSKIGDQYVLIGSLSPNSSEQEILLEINELSENTLEVIEALSKFLN